MIRLAIITWLVDRCLNMIESDLLDEFDMESSVDISEMVIGKSYRIQFTSRYVRYLNRITSSFGYVFMREMFDRINCSDVYIFKLTRVDKDSVECFQGELYLGGELIDLKFPILQKSLRYIAEL